MLAAARFCYSFDVGYLPLADSPTQLEICRKASMSQATYCMEEQVRRDDAIRDEADAGA